MAAWHSASTSASEVVSWVINIAESNERVLTGLITNCPTAVNSRVRGWSRMKVTTCHDVTALGHVVNDRTTWPQGGHMVARLRTPSPTHVLDDRGARTNSRDP